MQETVIGNSEISPGVFLMTFRRSWDFAPGQVVKVGLGNGQPPRIYSLCSGSSSNEAAILFNIKEDGYLTPKLAKLAPGDKIDISKPYGEFKDSDSPAWWIATGTGIAPFYSMLRSGVTENKRLIHGVRFLNQFYFENEFEQSLGDNYIRCCSRESGNHVFEGRVSTYLASLEALPAVNYYLCGKALMVVEVRDLLISKGVPFENILSEIYF
jgi:ferredoxin--NADP+ reductase